VHKKYWKWSIPLTNFWPGWPDCANLVPKVIKNEKSTENSSNQLLSPRVTRLGEF
jgi:hypothetical protein